MKSCVPGGIQELDKVFYGRIEPHIYAFATNTVPNYLKVGDTYRPVIKRLEEWRKFYPDLEKKYENKAMVDDETYFRDYAVHQYLLYELGKTQLEPDVYKGVTYSREFFKNTEVSDIDKAIEDIKISYTNNENKYVYYDASSKLGNIYHYHRGESWELRPNQKLVVDNFVRAVNSGRKNLLMYAVMRFGKSFTAMCCALAMDARLVLVVSAKVDVKEEWQKTVEHVGNFKEFSFFKSDDLERNENAIEDRLAEGGRVVIFVSLQDFQGDEIKYKHKELFREQIDLLIVDETHFGARAESFGKILRTDSNDKKEQEYLAKLNKGDHDKDEFVDGDERIKKLNARIKLHLSGTPYRILMGSEFEKEDVIAFVQFSDIVREQEEWDKEFLGKDGKEEWDNPYFGFPQMIRFAFHPNRSARAKMEALEKSGVNYSLSKLFEPLSIHKDDAGNRHKKFVYHSEILDLLKVIDGSKYDDELFGFLDYHKIKEGKMCRHMVMVLPYCASCDAMEELLNTHQGDFKNLGDYKVINISGLDAKEKYGDINRVKATITKYEDEKKKTITLTVNRMLTGSTVEEWDTMLFLKDTASPQEYDQAIFRLQNQHIKTIGPKSLHKSSKEEERYIGYIRENKKPQTLLVDFDPDRLFRMQEQKSLIYNANTEVNGNSKLKERIQEELRISPIITMNHNKIRMVEATNILEAVSDYNNKRSVSDEVLDIPIDLAMLDDEDIRRAIENQAEFHSKQGLTIDPYQGQGDDMDIEEALIDTKAPKEVNSGVGEDYLATKTDDELKKLQNQIKTYYLRLLFFSFLTKNRVSSLDDILRVLDNPENRGLAKNLFLEKQVLQKLSEKMDPFKRCRLDYKIQNISSLAFDEGIEPLTRAMTSIKKFNRMSESEVITPSNVCDEMVGMLPEKMLKEIVKNQDKILDIASKSGEYAVSLYKRLTSELGYTHEKVRNLIYSIPTSSVAYEFTRKFYEILGLNVDNIALGFNSYDLMRVKDERGNLDYPRFNGLLRQAKQFSRITLDDEIQGGLEKVKYGAVVGNPPYQEKSRDTSDKPIYNYFMDISHALTDYSCLITPARFLFNAGKTPKEWNKKLLNDPYFKVGGYEQDSSLVFEGVDIKGGLAITIMDKKLRGEPIHTFIPFEELRLILKKVREIESDFLNDFVFSPESYRFTKRLHEEHPEVSSKLSQGHMYDLTSNIFSKLDTIFIEESPGDETDYYCFLGILEGKRSYRWIKKDYISEHKNLLKYKVFVPKSNGSGAMGEVLSTPLIGAPLFGHTQSFISIGAFDCEFEAKALLKYVKTKFARAMLGTLKITQDNKKSTWANVPVQDFTQKSDINWDKSIHEIDLQLYKKYKLSDQEIDFIEAKVQSME